MKPSDDIKEYAPNIDGFAEMAELYGVCKETFYQMRHREPKRFIRYCKGASYIKEMIRKGVVE